MLISYWIPKLFNDDGSAIDPSIYATYEGKETTNLDDAYPFEDKVSCSEFCAKISKKTKKCWSAVGHNWTI